MDPIDFLKIRRNEIEALFSELDEETGFISTFTNANLTNAAKEIATIAYCRGIEAGRRKDINSKPVPAGQNAPANHSKHSVKRKRREA